MPAPVPYIHFPGTAREALGFYADVFGGTAALHTNEEFQRPDVPADGIAHGMVTGGAVTVAGSDAGPEDEPLAVRGLLLSLLGAAEPATLHEWFDRLAAGGTVLDPLGPKPWGDSDGQVRDRFGLHWLIGYQGTTR